MQPETQSESFAFENFMAWLYANRVMVAVVAAVVALVIAVLAIVSWKKSQDEGKANAALCAVPALIGPGAKTSEISPEPLRKIASEYPETGAGERAALLAGGVLFTEGKYPEAQTQF